MAGVKGRSGRKPKTKPPEELESPTSTGAEEEILSGEMSEIPPDVAARFENEIELDRIVSAVPTGTGYYAKVYRKYPLPPEYAGKLQLLDEFDLAGINDMESHILRLAKANQWPKGIYQVRVYQHDSPGIKTQPLNLTIDPALVNPFESATPVQEPTMNPSDRLKETLEIARMARESFGATSTDPTTLVKSLGEALSIGAKAVQPQEPARGGTSDQIMAALLAAALKPPPDPLQQIIVARQAGLLPEPKTQDQSLLDQITAIKTIVEALGGLGGGGGGEDRTSPTVELIRALAPQAGQIIGSITQAVGKFMDYQAEKLRVASGQPIPQGQAIPGLGTSATAIPPSPAQPALPAPPKPEDEMFALVNEINRRAQGKDYDFFPAMLDALERGPFKQMVEDHASGKLSDQEILNFLTGSIPQFGNQAAHEYLAAFLHWHAAQIKPNGRTEAEPAILATCQKCGEEYGFDSHDEFQQDSKICDAKNEKGEACNGAIEVKVGV